MVDGLVLADKVVSCYYVADLELCFGTDRNDLPRTFIARRVVVEAEADAMLDVCGVHA